MTSDTNFQSDHHFVRYVKPRLIIKDPETGDMALDPDALKPRDRSNAAGAASDQEPALYEKDISGNHLEYFNQLSVTAGLRALKQHLKEVVGFDLRPKGGFGVARADEIVAAGLQQNTKIEVQKQPTNDESHAVILGIQFDALLVQAAIAQTMAVYQVGNI